MNSLSPSCAGMYLSLCKLGGVRREKARTTPQQLPTRSRSLLAPWDSSTPEKGFVCRRTSDQRSLVRAATKPEQGAAAATNDNPVPPPMGHDVQPSHGVSAVVLPERSSPQMDEDYEYLKEDSTTQRITKVKAMLRSMGDGEISISAYDTAWVAMVPNLRGEGGPQFPSSLQWIEENQLPDGSWGDGGVFNAQDRLMNTLACVVALETWGISQERCQRGISFLRDNMHKIEDDHDEHMLAGFEVAFPSLLEIARSLGLDLPYDSPAFGDMYAKRALKLERIPWDKLHEVPTSLLYSLEGMPGQNWEKLLRLQCEEGSFLGSSSATAYALTHTRDAKCLGFLEKIVQRFNGGAPHAYPIELLERLWAVDRLERLGISRYFAEDIRRQCLDYAHEYWTDAGIGWARDTNIQDIDCTAMGFRLLRLHGYDVSPDVFRQFERDGEFVIMAGQCSQSVTCMHNLNRAAQVSFPGERILEEARRYTQMYLGEKQACDELPDKWVITKDLSGEVRYAMDFPWYSSLPRVETRFYLEQYGGDRDAWIAKTLYRMPLVSNDDYLELARSDFRRCQALQQLEWLSLQRWYEGCGLKSYGVSKSSLLRSYFLAAASIFEPERAAERLGWARTAILAQALSTHLRDRKKGVFTKIWYSLFTFRDSASVSPPVADLRNVAAGDDDHSMKHAWNKKTEMGLIGALLQTLDCLSSDAATSLTPGGAHVDATQRQIRDHLRRAWGDWMLAWCDEDQDEASHAERWRPGGAENDETGNLLVRSLELCAGRTGLEESLQADADPHHQYSQLTRLISSLCRQLRRHHRHTSVILGNNDGKGDSGAFASQDIEPDMQKLMLCVLRNPDGDNNSTLQTFLTVAKSFYYVANCPPGTMEHHIAKVLFEDVV